MRAVLACFVLIVLCSDNRAETGDRAKQQFQSDNYTVTWGKTPALEPAAALEIGQGNGHGGTLGWVRFEPAENGVDILSIQFDEGRHPYESKWPPDRTPVVVKRARLRPDAYVALLRDLAVVDSAKLKAIVRNGIMTSSNNFWVYALLTTDKKTLLDLNWSGYEGSVTELEFAKPQAAIRLGRETIKGLDFQGHTLTEGERAWASAKFARDWKKFKGRSLLLVGAGAVHPGDRRNRERHGPAGPA